MNGIETIEAAFERAERGGGRALVSYLCAGDPAPEETGALLDACVAGGADIIELGIPFSDPSADGPVIQGASERALRAGTRLDDVLQICRGFSQRHPSTPVILFGYWNPWHRRGAAEAARLAAEAGAAGLLVVDLPMAEASALDAACAEHGLARIYLVAPNTGTDRLRRIVERGTGFVYLVSIKGVTGAPLTELEDCRHQAEAIRGLTPLPVAVGFGVDGPERAARVGEFAEAVVVGSALVRRVADAQDPRARTAAARDFCRALKSRMQC